MKKYILLASLGAALIATGFGSWAVLGQSNVSVTDIDGAANVLVSTVRLYQLAGISGLLSISVFFVGLAYPLSTIETNGLDNGSLNSTRQVVNN